ncbi:hypothetical protein G6F70_006441 [Rhizopus microsporus]|uniref:Uncharacterized protein n=1 Tax=Rhizopus microsporus TaxID=58291 RepID=A0A1X0RNG3_RHIZD|nr:hypothetical protein G6F71_006247 [Rhizopus microsporus]KAG1197652.1 hypothetical protein G6F70_006441 [Rhizopus microsporus]KAG1209542.1 hypothetical protein G6F69_006264 [Rhizopus microsporus]KAG1230991.1 hypothetical protein G6F67_006077 [Rhizopus microsporus]KAG1263561.1 hypothetical protein G6F68_005046 [Rhizopus microsporus]
MRNNSIQKFNATITTATTINNAKRRVSFDLSHNTVYLLPSFEECRDAAKQARREEWQKKTLNEEMLSEDIIVEIQADTSANARHLEEQEQKDTSATVQLKSCLKKPPMGNTEEDRKKKHTGHHKKNNHKKRKRSSSKSSHLDKVSMISVH